MKNITVLTVLVIIPFLAAPLHAQGNGNYSLAAKPLFGMNYGHTEEIVYSVSDAYYSDVISSLIWDIKPIFYYGLDLDFSPENLYVQSGVYANFSFKFGIPSISGLLVDRDWSSPVNNELTDYSEHDNYTENLFLLDFMAGYSLPFKSIFNAKFFLAFSYMSFGFSGQDGFGYYSYSVNKNGQIIPPGERVSFNGMVISYSQEWVSLSAGFSLGVNFLKNFFFDLNFKLSPLIACVALDFHAERDKQFKDYVMGGFFYEPGARLIYSINKKIGVSLYVSYKGIIGTSGANYSRNVPSDPYFNPGGKAGTELSLIDSGLMFNLRL